MKAEWNEIEKQYIGFFKTPQLFKNQSISPYPNFELNEFPFPSEVQILQKELKNLLYVGKRMEIFFKNGIKKHENYHLITHSLQLINKNKQTLGEIDFLVQDVVNQSVFQVELVVKFYIFDPSYSTNPLKCFMGPKRKDFLYKKLEKLHTHQFPILFSEIGKNNLEKLKLTPKSLQQKICFKAQVYLPYAIQVNLPDYINPSAVAGYWLPFSNFNQLSTKSDYLIPKKQNWMVKPELTEASSMDFFSCKKAVEKSLKDGHAPMLWEKTQEGKMNSYFIVAD